MSIPSTAMLNIINRIYLIGFIAVFSLPVIGDTVNPAVEVIDNAIQSYGGQQNWIEKRTMVVNEIQTRYTDEGANTEKLTHYMDVTGGGYKVEIERVDGMYTFGWDGHNFWAVLDGQQGSAELLQEARRVISDAYYRFSLPFILSDADGKPEYQGQDIVNGLATQVVKITYEDGPTSRYWADHTAVHQQGDHRQSNDNAEAGAHHHAGHEVYYFHFDKDYRIVKVYFSHHGDNTYETFFFHDYKNIEGISREHRRQLVRPDGNVHYDTIFSGIEFRKDIGEDFYRAPLN